MGKRITAIEGLRGICDLAKVALDQAIDQARGDALSPPLQEAMKVYQAACREVVAYELARPKVVDEAPADPVVCVIRDFEMDFRCAAAEEKLRAMGAPLTAEELATCVARAGAAQMAEVRARFRTEIHASVALGRALARHPHPVALGSVSRFLGQFRTESKTLVVLPPWYVAIPRRRG